MKKKLTQAQLAERCGISKNALWNYENNKRNINIEILTNIATELGVPISYLLDPQETLTSKLFNFIDTKLYPESDALNTLEIVAESIDLDFDELSNALNNHQDLSESYLSSMIKLIYKDNENLFYEFYEENKELIFSKYWICAQLCNELINKVSVDKSLITKTHSTLKRSINMSETYEDLISFFHDEVENIENDPKYLLNAILTYLENTEKYHSPVIVNFVNNNDSKPTCFTEQQVNDIILKITELVKYEIYKIEMEQSDKNNNK